MPGRRIKVQPEDTLVFDGYDVCADTLKTMVLAEARLLWAFIKKDGEIRPVAYDEHKVVWLEPTDLTYGRERMDG